MNLKTLAEEKNTNDLGKVFFDLESVLNPLFNFHANANLLLKKENGAMTFVPSLEVKTHIKSFKRAVPVFAAYTILIPSPFDVLDGEIHLDSIGDILTTNDEYIFPLKLQTNLSSKNQAIKITSLSKIHLNKDFKELLVEAKLLIDTLNLELPPLKLSGGNPRIVKDRRIIKNKSPPPTSTGEFKFFLDLEIETTKNEAIKFFHQFFEPYLALNLNINSTKNQKNSGEIDILPFDIVYLRRRVHLEKMKIKLRDNENDPLLIDGRFKIKRSLYTIYIDVTGTGNHPFIELSSEPYLNRSDIVSVLIYDRTQGELVSADAETAGSVEAAIVDRAVGLFGLWAFASTPITSFHYNPISKVYTASLDLGKGVSASIGSDWDSSTSLELRKRISKRWVITGRWQSPTQKTKEKSELVLQWEKRF